jgi:branched-subunit amino acid transport protein
MHLFSSRRWVSVNDTLSKVEAPTAMYQFSPLFDDLFVWGNWNDSGDWNASIVTSFAMLVIAFFLAFGFDSIVSILWEFHQKQQISSSKSEVTGEVSASTDVNGGSSADCAGNILPNPAVTFDSKKRQNDDWHSTFVYGLTHGITTAARAYLGLIVTELLLDRCPGFMQIPFHLYHYHSTTENDQQKNSTLPSSSSLRLQEAAPFVACIMWIGLTVCTIKRIILFQNAQHKTQKLIISGRIMLLNRTLDVVVYLIMTLLILNEISTDSHTNSVILHSLLSAGGIGALILSFATKDLATEIVGGVALGVWNVFNVGDRVRFDNGISGKIMEIGVVETIIQR